MPDGAEQYFENRRKFHLEAAMGRQAIEQDQRFYGVSVEQFKPILQEFQRGVRDGIFEAFKNIAAGLWGG